MVAKKDMPGTIRRSGKKARETYSTVLDSAIDRYGDGERAHRTALAALKHTHEKVGDHWEKKPGGKKGPSDKQAAGGRTKSGKVTNYKTQEGVDANASKKHLLDVAKRLDVKGRSTMRKSELVEAIKKANRRKSAKATR